MWMYRHVAADEKCQGWLSILVHVQVHVQTAPATVWNLSTPNGWYQLACDAFFLCVAILHIVSALKALQQFRLQATGSVCTSTLYSCPFESKLSVRISPTIKCRKCRVRGMGSHACPLLNFLWLGCTASSSP